MTRNEYIASIMLEAADLLNESAGGNGFLRKGMEMGRDKVNKEASYLEDKAKRENDPKKRESYTNRAKNLRKTYSDTMRGFDTRVGGELGKTRATLSKVALKEMEDFYSDPRERRPDHYRNSMSDKSKALHNKINSRALKEAIDIFYDYATNCDTLDEAIEYINKAEELEKVLYEDYE